jgi:hypothetical protein
MIDIINYLKFEKNKKIILKKQQYYFLIYLNFITNINIICILRYKKIYFYSYYLFYAMSFIFFKILYFR